MKLEQLSEGYFNGLGVAIVDSTGILFEQGIGYADVEAKKAYLEYKYKRAGY